MSRVLGIAARRTRYGSPIRSVIPRTQAFHSGRVDRAISRRPNEARQRERPAPQPHATRRLSPSNRSTPAIGSSETQAFNHMYDQIFPQLHREKQYVPRAVPLDVEDSRHAVSHQPSSSFSELLERRQDEIEGCANDHDLVLWANSLFERQRQIEEGTLSKGKGVESAVDEELETKAYPFVLGMLIQTFRNRYRDPHLALSVFDHARRMSLRSYVTGCTTPAYNEYLKTLWEGFRDPHAVTNALEEMKVNGVDPDKTTRQLAERIINSGALARKDDKKWPILIRLEELSGLKDDSSRGYNSSYEALDAVEDDRPESSRWRSKPL